MEQFLTDMHTHSKYSHDGQAELSKMLETAHEKGFAFYGVSEHFDYDYDRLQMTKSERAELTNADPEVYFHGARHLQEDYEGCMNVLIGAEFGFSRKQEVANKYLSTFEKYRPDFIINSVHGGEGRDFCRDTFTEDKGTVYRMYLQLIRDSLDAPYPYDIVGHIGYIARYVPYADNRLSLEEFGAEIDDILKTIIQKDKILEVNSSNKHLANRTLPSAEIVRRYFELGGRKISYGSDAHGSDRIGDKREEVVALLKEIGFEYLTVPCCGEHIKVKI